MITLCCSCKAYLGGNGDSDDGISHGFCQPCADEYIASYMRYVNEGGRSQNKGEDYYEHGGVGEGVEEKE